MGRRQAGVDWMKRKIVLGYMLAACMVLASCQGKDSGLDVMTGGGQQTEQSLKPGQEGWEDGTGHAGKDEDQSQGSDRNADQSQGSDRNADQSQGSDRNIDQSRDNDQQAAGKQIQARAGQSPKINVSSAKLPETWGRIILYLQVLSFRRGISGGAFPSVRQRAAWKQNGWNAVS